MLHINSTRRNIFLRFFFIYRISWRKYKQQQFVGNSNTIKVSKKYNTKKQGNQMLNDNNFITTKQVFFYVSIQQFVKFQLNIGLQYTFVRSSLHTKHLLSGMWFLISNIKKIITFKVDMNKSLKTTNSF